MTAVAAPKITKQYRLRWRSNGVACYATVTDEGSELLLIHADGSRFHSIIGGVCIFHVFGTCTWPDCPRRNSPVETVPEPLPVPDTASVREPDAPTVIEPAESRSFFRSVGGSRREPPPERAGWTNLPA